MRLTALLTMLGIAAVPRSVPAQFPTADSGAVIETLHRFHDALRGGDSLTAIGLLADDALVLEGGTIETREDYRKGHLGADMRSAQAVKSTRRIVGITVRGDVAWVVAESETTRTVEERQVNSTGAELMVLTRTAGGWRIRAVHWSSRRPTQ